MLNLQVIIGNLGADPEKRFTPSGRIVCRFRMASNRRWTSPDGVKVEQAEWHSIEVWGKQAEACAEYLKKGKMVCVVGRHQTDTTGEGDARQYFHKTVANQVIFLTPANGNTTVEEVESEEPEDIPF